MTPYIVGARLLMLFKSNNRATLVRPFRLLRTMKTRFIILISGIAIIFGMGVYLYAMPQPRQGNQAMPAVSPPIQRAIRSPIPIPSHAVSLTPSAVIPTAGTPSATPSTIVVNTPITVTVTAPIAPTPIINGVNLLRISATGTQPTVFGMMHDDGKNGDAVAGDGIYTLQVAFNESIVGQVNLQVSAAFQGLLKRIMSPIATISVWSVYSSPTSKFLIDYPAALATETASDGSLHLETQGINVSDSENIATGDFIIDVFTTTVADNPDYLSRISDSITLVLPNGSTGVLGNRADNTISPLPGYDMYVAVGNTLYVVAGTYDGVSGAALAQIKAIDKTFQDIH